MNDLLSSAKGDLKEREDMSLDKKKKKRKSKKEPLKTVTHQQQKEITISDEEELTNDGTGVSSSGTTIGQVTTSDDGKFTPFFEN
jgi:hypothetical protein